MTDLYDIAIIGTGPAGLEAAITAKIRNKEILVLGSANSSLKVQKAHEIQNYLGLPSISGEAMKNHFLKHASNMGVEITEDRAIAIYNLGDYFGIQTKNSIYSSRSIILATGVVAGKTYPKEEELLGRGVSYCATCDAPLYRGKTAAIIASSAEEEPEADFMKEYADKVYYFPLYNGEVHVRDGIEVIYEKPLEIIGDEKVASLVTDKNEYTVDGVFILREAISPGQLIPGIETEGPHIKVNLDMSTSMPGVFACGDIAGLPYQYIKAAGQGNTAALSAVSYLAAIDRKK